MDYPQAQADATAEVGFEMLVKMLSVAEIGSYKFKTVYIVYIEVKSNNSSATLLISRV